MQKCQQILYLKAQDAQSLYLSVAFSPAKIPGKVISASLDSTGQHWTTDSILCGLCHPVSSCVILCPGFADGMTPWDTWDTGYALRRAHCPP